MLSTSLKPLEQTMEFPPRFIPDPEVRPQNYCEVLTHRKMTFPLLAATR